MSTGTQTLGQMVARYDRLKRRVDTVMLPDGLQKDLVDIAKMTLEMFPITTNQAPAVAVPSQQEVEPFIKHLLPSPLGVFNESFFRAPLFALANLYDVSDFSGCFPGLDAVMQSLGLSTQDRSYPSSRTHVWFADLLSCEKETILAVVDRYKAFSGSPDMLRRLTPSSRVHVSSERDGRFPRAQTPVQGGQREVEVQASTAGDPASHANQREASNRSPRAGYFHEPETVPPNSSRAVTDIEAQDKNDSRKATNVFQYFKDSKFTGDISQSVELTIKEYNVCARQHNLTAKQKADFFVNVLADPARTFFFNNAQDDMSFEDMARLMVREYNSDARPLQVQGRLDTLRLDKVMTEHQISSHSEGLTKIVDLIECLTPQCQPQFRSDANKISYLRKAVLGFNWAMVPIDNIITAKYSFNAFVTALREHLQLENKVSLSNPSATGSLKEIFPGTFHQ